MLKFKISLCGNGFCLIFVLLKLETMELNTAKQYCEDLLKKYNLDVKGWKFGKFDTSIRRLGICRAGTKRCIDLSKNMTLHRSDDEVKNTIIHEVAHAIDYVTRGTSSHDNVWRNIFLAMGGDGNTRTHVDKELVNKTYKYIITCPTHGQLGGFVRRPKNADRYTCKKCGGKIEVKINNERSL